MKKLITLMVVSLMLIAAPAMAEVTWEILSVKQDVNGNIEVHTQYKVDGVEQISRYPQEDGKYYWVTRFNAQNFIGMSDAEIKARIEIDCKEFADYLQKSNWMQVETDKIAESHLNGLVGSKGKVTQSEIEVDTDGDNKVDKIFTVKSTGEKVSEKTIANP